MKNLKMLDVKKNEGKSMKKSSFLFSAYTIELEEFYDKKTARSIRGKTQILKHFKKVYVRFANFVMNKPGLLLHQAGLHSCQLLFPKSRSDECHR